MLKLGTKRVKRNVQLLQWQLKSTWRRAVGPPNVITTLRKMGEICLFLSHTRAQHDAVLLTVAEYYCLRHALNKFCESRISRETEYFSLTLYGYVLCVVFLVIFVTILTTILTFRTLLLLCLSGQFLSDRNKCE